MGLFVKFVPWNSNTLTSLINKTVKFSRVDEFNDFGEFRFIAFEDKIAPNSAEQIREKIQDIDIQSRLLKIAKAPGSNYTDDEVNLLRAFLQDIKSINFREPNVKILIETFIFNCTGIFCISSVDVFNDTSAMVMFAHYAKNASGLALVYEIDENNLIKVEYRSEVLSMFVSNNSPENDWISDKFDNNNVNAFTVKAKPWEYEHEYRMLSTPKIVAANEMGIKLKAILFTGALENYSHSIKVLDKINRQLYQDALALTEIRLSAAKDKFLTEEQDVYSYLTSL